MTDDRQARIAPPPSVDDVLSSLTDDSRIGQVDFTVALAPDPAPPSAGVDVAANRPETVRARAESERRAAHVVPAEPEPEPEVDAEVEVEPEVEIDEEPDEDVDPEPEPEPVAAKPKKARRPKEAPEPAVEPVVEDAVPEPEWGPEPEPEEEPELAVVVALEPVAGERVVDVARAVEEVAAEVIGRIRTAEEATLRHLDAMELEATRRYELVTAQAELDAELIRLQSRREAHAIVTAARLRAGEIDDIGDDPDDEGHRLSVFSDAVSRVADTTDSSLNRGRGDGGAR